MIVEVRTSAANMRSWLDHNRCAVARFETMSPEPGVVLIRAVFGAGADAAESAAAFQRAFGNGTLDSADTAA